MNSIINKPSFCSLQNKIRTIEEVLSSWIMDFFDDPIYSDQSRQWNTTSLMMLRPQASVVIYLYYYHQWMANHDLLIHNMNQFIISLLVKTNQLPGTIYNCMHTLSNKTVWFKESTNKTPSNKENHYGKGNANLFTCVSITPLFTTKIKCMNVCTIDFCLTQWFTYVNTRRFFNVQPLLVFRVVKKKLYKLIL